MEFPNHHQSACSHWNKFLVATDNVLSRRREWLPRSEREKELLKACGYDERQVSSRLAEFEKKLDDAIKNFEIEAQYHRRAYERIICASERKVDSMEPALEIKTEDDRHDSERTNIELPISGIVPNAGDKYLVSNEGCKPFAVIIQTAQIQSEFVRFDKLPTSLRLDNTRGEVTWQSGYEDGEVNMLERQYAVQELIGRGCWSYRWVKLKHLRNWDESQIKEEEAEEIIQESQRQRHESNQAGKRWTTMPLTPVSDGEELGRQQDWEKKDTEPHNEPRQPESLIVTLKISGPYRTKLRSILDSTWQSQMPHPPRRTRFETPASLMPSSSRFGGRYKTPRNYREQTIDPRDKRNDHDDEDYELEK